MLSHLDCIIFPDRCEVIEVIPSQRYVYPIFKNGQSSLKDQTHKSKWKIYLNNQIRKINNIDIFLRDPAQRFESGVSSFIQTTLRDNPDLDIHTVKWFAENYLHLDRHYAPQFSWIVNLARYTHPDCVLNFLSMDHIKTITEFHAKPFEQLSVNTQLKNNEMYQRIDQTLFECIGLSMTFGQLVAHVKHKDNCAYDWVIGRSQRILNPIYALP